MTDHSSEDRRKFLASCGRFAAITTPAMTLLLSTALTSNAIAQSGGRVNSNVNSGGGSAGDYRGNTPISGGGGDYAGFGGGCGDHTPPTDDNELLAWIERMQKENPECTLDEILRSRPSTTLRVKG